MRNYSILFREFFKSSSKLTNDRKITRTKNFIVRNFHRLSIFETDGKFNIIEFTITALKTHLFHRNSNESCWTNKHTSFGAFQPRDCIIVNPYFFSDMPSRNSKFYSWKPIDLTHVTHPRVFINFSNSAVYFVRRPVVCTLYDNFLRVRVSRAFLSLTNVWIVHVPTYDDQKRTSHVAAVAMKL